MHAVVFRPGVRREVVIPESLEDLARRALTLPTASRLRALARELAELPSPDTGPAEAVEIQVWAPDFDRASLAPSGSMLRFIRVEIGGG